MKKQLKSCLSLFLALVLALSVVPLAALAGDKIDFKSVDYSKLVNEWAGDVVGSSAPYITEEYDGESYSGHANGYYTYLFADMEYTFYVQVSGTDTVLVSYAFAVLNYDTDDSSELSDSVIAVTTGSETDGILTLELTVTPEETGFYKLLLWGRCEDSSETQLFGADTYIQIELYSDLDYADVDYSCVIAPDRVYNDYISPSDPFIYLDSSTVDWYGAAQGYTVYLTKGVEYEIGVEVSCENAYYVDRAIVVLKNELSGDIDEDFVAGAEKVFYNGVVTPLVFTPDETGYYKILSWGYCDDESNFPIVGETETSVEIYVDAEYSGGYYSVPYDTKLTVGEKYDYFVDYRSSYGYLDNYDGTLEGFTVELEADKKYIFEFTLGGEGDEFWLDAVILNEEMVDNWPDDVIEYTYGYDFARLAFTPEASGTYKIAVCNSVRYGGEEIYGEKNTSASILVREPVSKEFDISDADDFNAISGVEADFVTLNLLNDIDMSDYTGGLSGLFNVTLNGNCHIIDGLSVPLFGDVNTLEVSDLEINFEYNFDDETNSVYSVGALAGWADNAYIYNCHVNGSIDVTALACSDIGGLIGAIYYEGILEHCSANVDITIHGDGGYVGGLLGYLYGYGSTGSLVFDCHSNGDVKIDGGGYIRYIGGLFGDVEYYTAIESCSASGSITIELLSDSSDYLGYVGGIAGYVEDYCQFTNCFADVEIDAEYGYYVGGFVGYIDEENLFYNCYAKGDIVADYNVGGFAGVSDCCGYNEFVNCYALGDVIGYEDVGGFIGELYDGDCFVNCYAAGVVIPLDDAAIDYFGGFAGYGGDVSEVEFIDCYAADSPVFGEVYVYDSEMDSDLIPVGVEIIDFSDAEEVETLMDAFNANVETMNDYEGAEVFLEWIVDDEGTLTLDYPEVMSPDKPCKHIISVGFNGYDDEYHWHECEIVGCNHAECSVTGKAKHEMELVSDTATCTEGGVATYKCADCEYSYTEPSESKGHTDADGNMNCDDCGEPIASAYKLGDINDNGTIDSMDYVLLKRAYFGTYKLKDIAVGDINKNGSIDSMDYVYLRRAYFGTYVIR